MRSQNFFLIWFWLENSLYRVSDKNKSRPWARNFFCLTLQKTVFWWSSQIVFSKTCLTITYPLPLHIVKVVTVTHCMWNRHILILEPRNIETLQRHFWHWSYLARNFKIRTLFQSKMLQQQAQIICQNVCL